MHPHSPCLQGAALAGIQKPARPQPPSPRNCAIVAHLKRRGATSRAFWGKPQPSPIAFPADLSFQKHEGTAFPMVFTRRCGLAQKELVAASPRLLQLGHEAWQNHAGSFGAVRLSPVGLPDGRRGVGMALEAEQSRIPLALAAGQSRRAHAVLKRGGRFVPRPLPGGGSGARFSISPACVPARKRVNRARS